MKSFLVALGVLCLVITGAVIHANVKHDAPAPLTAIAPVAAEVATSPAPAIAQPSIPRPHALVATAKSRPNDPIADAATDPVHETVNLLVSRTATFQQREAQWRQLNDLEHLNPVLEALKQGAADHPDSPEYQAALGKGNLQKAGIVSLNGGGVNELGILGMTADQNFDAALKIDPSNWDAQFLKAVAISYWPAELNKGDEVVQRFTGLIDQQDTESTRPEFALPYIALGQQYQKLGQNANALQTWQAGATKFPDDATLQQKLASAQGK